MLPKIGFGSIAAGSSEPQFRPCPLCPPGSTGRRNTGVKSLRWGFECQSLTWPFVELTSHFVEMSLRIHRQVGPLREVLPQQSIGVFIGTALPRTVRIAEVKVAKSRSPLSATVGTLSALHGLTCSRRNGFRPPTSVQLAISDSGRRISMAALRLTYRLGRLLIHRNRLRHLSRMRRH